MHPLRRLIAVAVEPFANLFRPPPAADTTPEIEAVEREIDEEAEPLAVRRMLQLVGHGVYCLGAGGRRPDASDPYSSCAKPGTHRHAHRGRVFCDCSGAICWALGIPRKDPVTGRWLNTDEMERLARRQDIAWMHARPGDVLVFGAGAAIGHCGMVTRCDVGGPSMVAHFSASGTVGGKHEPPTLFKRKGALVWRP
jgi:cell wall-associated NlpC family hydrolase